MPRSMSRVSRAERHPAARRDGSRSRLASTVKRMEQTHRGRVEALLSDAAAEHAGLMSQLSPELRASLPVDAQGVTRAIDHLAAAAGLSDRVCGRAPIARETVIGSFVEGARVRADALAALADLVDGEPLGRDVRRLLGANPPP